MDLNHLFYFKKVAELQNMTRAAEELMITQPALSRVIHHLENEVGVKFFDWVGKNILLNEKGRIFLKYTNEILEALNQANREIQELESDERTTITLVMRGAISILPFLLKAFKEQYPHIDVQVIRGLSEKQANTDVDFYLDITLKPEEQNGTTVLLEEDSGLLISRQLLESYPEKPQLADFKNETFFVLSNSVQRTVTETACKGAGFHPQISTDFLSSETIYSFLEIGFGVAIVPAKTWNYSAHPSLVMPDIPIHADKRYIILRWRDTGNSNITAFREFCIYFFQELQRSDDIHACMQRVYSKQDR